MSDLERENENLRKENLILKEKEMHSNTAMKVAIYGAVCVVCYFIAPHSQLVAGAIAAGAFYFCFMH